MCVCGSVEFELARRSIATWSSLIWRRRRGRRRGRGEKGKFGNRWSWIKLNQTIRIKSRFDFFVTRLPDRLESCKRSEGRISWLLLIIIVVFVVLFVWRVELFSIECQNVREVQVLALNDGSSEFVSKMKI